MGLSSATELTVWILEVSARGWTTWKLTKNAGIWTCDLQEANQIKLFTILWPAEQCIVIETLVCSLVLQPYLETSTKTSHKTSLKISLKDSLKTSLLFWALFNAGVMDRRPNKSGQIKKCWMVEDKEQENYFKMCSSTFQLVEWSCWPTENSSLIWAEEKLVETKVHCPSYVNQLVPVITEKLVNNVFEKLSLNLT